MIKIGKIDAIYSYIGYFLKVFSSILVLPIILNKIPVAEYGIWSVFISINALTVIFDLGFGNVITRYITYAYCGAKEILKEGIPEVEEKEKANFDLLFEIFFVAKRIYKKVGIIVALVLLVFGLYVVGLSENTILKDYVLIAWFFYAMGIYMSMYFNYYNSFVKGLGMIKEIQKITIYNQIIYIIAQFVLVSLGFGLIGLGISYFFATLLLVIQLNRKVKKIILNHEDAFYKAKKKTKTKQIKDSELYKSINYNSKKIGYVLITNYIQGQGSILLCSVFLTLEQTAMYGLTMQLIGIVISMATIPFSTFLPQLSAYRISKENEKLKNLYSSVMVSIFLIYFFGSVIMLIFCEPILNLIHSNTKILPLSYLLILLFYQFILVNHQRATNFISVGNEQPYVKAYILSSLVSLILDLICFMLGFGLQGFMIVNLLVQLSYNAWKWPQEALKVTNLTLSNIICRFFKNFKKS
ncbi:MAG: O-unit flippase-like protein [Clostridia bacterium]|nr:O-unit flippase-like protein [Clostridia bacterium]MDD4386492.1 O-unit flippase-like protein [Clostridia bacterium]